MTSPRRPLGIRVTPHLAALMVLVLLASAAPAQDNQAISRARTFLDSASRGRHVLGSLHFGAQFRGHAYQRTVNVRNKPTDFALVYRFNWENDGVTDLAFLCDSKGVVYQVQVTYTNAILSQPFSLANASITILGNLLLEAFRNQMTADEQQQARQLIDSANARGLLEMSLRLQQAFGR